MKLLHVGVPIPYEKRGADVTYIADMKLAVSDPEAHPFHLEFISFDPDSPAPDIIMHTIHIAYEVDDVTAALAQCDEIVLPLQDIGPELLAFGLKDGALLELIHTK